MSWVVVQFFKGPRANVYGPFGGEDHANAMAFDLVAQGYKVEVTETLPPVVKDKPSKR